MFKELKEMRREFELERTQRLLQDEQNKNNQLDALRKQVSKLEAELTVEKSKSATIIAEAKSAYADHAMQINDERIKEMRAVYENYARNVVDIVKAGTHPASVTVVPANNVQGK